jgi:hypothetical protein
VSKDAPFLFASPDSGKTACDRSSLAKSLAKPAKVTGARDARRVDFRKLPLNTFGKNHATV